MDDGDKQGGAKAVDVAEPTPEELEEFEDDLVGLLRKAGIDPSDDRIDIVVKALLAKQTLQIPDPKGPELPIPAEELGKYADLSPKFAEEYLNVWLEGQQVNNQIGSAITQVETSSVESINRTREWGVKAGLTVALGCLSLAAYAITVEAGWFAALMGGLGGAGMVASLVSAWREKHSGPKDVTKADEK